MSTHSARFRFRWIFVVLSVVVASSVYLLVWFEGQRSTYYISMYAPVGFDQWFDTTQPQQYGNSNNTPPLPTVQRNTSAAATVHHHDVETEKQGMHNVNRSHYRHQKPEQSVPMKRLKPTVFYNIYVTKKNFNDVKRIVQEQLKQLVSSYAASSGSNNESLMQVMYKTIGNPFDLAINGALHEICTESGLQCHHLGHQAEGHEMITLQSMLEYCQKNPSHRVIYLHPKGSFHRYKNDIQDPWRRNLTRAATSQACTEPTDSACNVCGLDFQPTWGPIVMGTMFQADCSYVRKLVSPHDIDPINKRAYETRPVNMTANLYAYLAFSAGYDRYAAELYIGSHPDLVPCDESGSSPKQAWPSHEFNALMEYQNGYSNGSMAHVREWFLLGGLLWRYHTMYNSTPPDSSWVWWYFPDAAKWQSAVKKHGIPEAVYRASRDNRIPS